MKIDCPDKAPLRAGADAARRALGFRLRTVDAYHVVVPQHTYWQAYQANDRIATARFQLKPGWRTVYARNVETAIVKVTLDDGSVGFGEATEPICPEVICRLAVGLLAPVLGDAEWPGPASAWDAAYDLQRGRGHSAGYLLHAMAALDIAIWDALAHRARLPLAALLSANPARRVTAYLSGIRRATVTDRIAMLSELVDDGLTAAKLFVGNDTAATLREIAGLRDGVRGDCTLMVDALWSYDAASEACDAKSAFGAAGLRWFECPLVPEDLEGHRVLATGAGAPIALGEHFFSHWQVAPWLNAKAVDVLQPDVGRTSLSDGLRQRAMAEAAGIDVVPHMGSGSPIVQAAVLHFAAAAGGDKPLCEYQFDLSGLLPDAFESAWAYERGYLEVPTEPGLGVSVDEAALTGHTASVDRWQR